MDNPGPIQLTYQGGAFQITGAGVFVGDWILNLQGMLAASLQAQFQYGSGGQNCTVYIQTSIDQGQTAIDVAAIQFGQVPGTEIVNLSGLTPETTPAAPTQQSLAPGSSNDGFLGDRLRAVVVVAGAYNNSTILNVTGIVR